MWPSVISEVTNVPEEEIRIALRTRFDYIERGRQKCSVRIKSVDDAERLTSQLVAWFHCLAFRSWRMRVPTRTQMSPVATSQVWMYPSGYISPTEHICGEGTVIRRIDGMAKVDTVERDLTPRIEADLIVSLKAKSGE